MTKFHKSNAWRKLSKEFKTPTCEDCGSTKELQSGHILAASRFDMSKLWKSNLKLQCQTCNLKQGVRIKWSTQAIKLLAVYGMIKALRLMVMVIVIVVLSYFIYVDVNRGPWDTTITYQIYSELLSAFQSLELP